MVRTIIIIILASLASGICSGQDNAIGKFAASVNPLGFLQFGPTVNAEFGLPNNLVLNIHLRAPSLGILSYVVSDGPDKISGLAAGAGLIYFFTDQKNKPYLGGLLGRQKTTNIFDEGEPYEKSEKDKVVYFAVNGGYRFRMNGGFFISTGAFLGAASSHWNKQPTDPVYGNAESGTSVIPFGMLEVSLGFEF